MLSARSISCIWKITVALFSNTRETLSPTDTRRCFLRSMISRRKAARFSS